MKPRLRLPLPLAILALAVAYYAAARLGLLLAFEDSNASPVWPPSGIALAALGLFGARLLPGVALGAFAANAVVFAANGAAGWPTIVAASLAITVGNSLEAWLGARLLARWIGAGSPFERLADVAKFIAVAALAGVASASIGTATLVASGIAPAAAAPTIALTWWVGDAAGMLILGPLLMVLLGASPRPRQQPREGVLALLLAALLVALGVAVFGDPLADRRLAWLFMPCIAWAAFRHGPRGVAAASMLIAGMAVWATTRGLGPFAHGNLNDALIVLQTFVGLTAVTGLVLAADRRERQLLAVRRALPRDVALPWLVLLGTLAVTVVGWDVVASGSQRRAEERFAYVGADIRDRLLARMTANEQVLRGAAGLFAASQEVEREEWRAYVDRLELPLHFPGIQAVGFARHLAPGEREAFETAVRREGHEDFAVKPDRPPHEAATSIVYIEPFDPRNRRAFGYDMSTEPVRRAAMERARDSGEPALSGKVALVQETGADVQAGVLLYLPVYRNGAPVGTVAERRAALMGYVYSPFRMSNLMRGALGPVAEVEGLAVRLYSGAEADVSDAALLFAHGLDQRAAKPLFHSLSVVEIAGQPWTLAFDTLPRFEATVDVQKAQIVLVAGVGLSLLLFGLVRSLTMTRERAELLADDMTVALRASEAKFRSLAESAGEAIVIADAQGRVVSWNRAAEAIFGHREDDVMGRDMALLMPERFRAAHRDSLRRLAAGGEAQVLGRSLQLTGLHARGHEFPIELSLASWETPGSGRHYSGIIRDITARERAAEALRDSERAARAAERELQAVLRASPLGVVFTDADGALRYGNPSFLRIAGLPLDELRGPGWRRSLHPDDFERVRADWGAAVAAHAPYEGEFRYLHADGRVVWARALGAPIVEDGVTLGFVATVEDVSARVAAAAELAAKNEALLRSNAELAQFAYVASHDLKEPLRTVASYSQLLLRRQRARLDDEGREFLDFIGDGARRAQTLIADLLSLARLDSTAAPLQPVPLNAVFAQARQQLAAAIGDAAADVDCDPLPTVLGDRGQLVQLMQNLIGNAIKFRGAARPRVHVTAEREADGRWRVNVADNGIGIDARFHEKIFTLFQRLHRAEYPGTGLGLAICKKVVERHGGQIGVHSVPGEGATFFFTIADAGTRAHETQSGALHEEP